MKCPYRKKIIHSTGGMYGYPSDIEEFEDCYKENCPFYRSEKEGYSGENCSKADAEVRRYK